MNIQIKQSFENVVREFETEVAPLTETERAELRRVYDAASVALMNAVEKSLVHDAWLHSRANIYYLDGHFYADGWVSTYGPACWDPFSIDGVEELEDTDDAAWNCVLTADYFEEEDEDDEE